MAEGIPMEAPLGEGYKYDIHSYDSALSKGCPRLYLSAVRTIPGNTIDQEA